MLPSSRSPPLRTPRGSPVPTANPHAPWTDVEGVSNPAQTQLCTSHPTGAKCLLSALLVRLLLAVPTPGLRHAPDSLCPLCAQRLSEAVTLSVLHAGPRALALCVCAWGGASCPSLLCPLGLGSPRENWGSLPAGFRCGPYLSEDALQLLAGPHVRQEEPGSFCGLR